LLFTERPSSVRRGVQELSIWNRL